MVEDLFRAPRNEDGIPVLTEVMNAPTFPGASAKTAATAQAAATKPLATQAAAMAFGVPPVMEREIGAPLNAPQTAAPEQNPNETQLREVLLSRVLPRIEAVLEHRLNETTREVLDQVIPLLRDELQNALSATAKDVISRAVNQEIAKLGRV